MTRGKHDVPAGDGNHDVTALVRRHWNGRAGTFDDEPHHGVHDEEQRERWLSVLENWTGEPPLDVLDVGCGTGVLSILLARLGHEVTGIDLAPRMVERAREKVRTRDLTVEFGVGDATRLGVADDSVDAVTARHLLWSLPDPEEAVTEWRRVVRPGGRVVLLEGKWDHDDPWDEYDELHDDLPLFHGRHPDDLATILERAGLRDVRWESLMDPVLWGREPRHEYYVLSGGV